MAESIAGLRLVGVREEDVHFLGYPDGALARLGETPLPPRERATPEGRCGVGSGTYANRGASHQDEHTRRTGVAAPWTQAALVEDLTSLLSRLRPAEVYISHGIDEHPDHAATYVYFRRALDALEGPPPVIHRAVVHAGQCWPGDCVTNFLPARGIPPLPFPHETYAARERLSVDAKWKLEVLSQHPSQTGPKPMADWLASFARREEVFFPERLSRFKGHWARTPIAEPFEIELGAHTSFKVNQTDQYEVTVSSERVTMHRLTPDGRRRVASWPRLEPGPLTLRVDPRPDDGDVTEWTLWGRKGLVGVEVLAPLVARVDVELGQASATTR
jgi:LmbE family N-acetylglucosaminyl deacetylase